MGYDMSTEIQDPRVAAAKACYFLSWEDGVEFTDEKKEQLRDEYHRLESEIGGYFRLNIFGMGAYRDIMDDFGMVNDDPAPPFIDAPEDIDWDKYHEDPLSYPEYREADNAVLGFEGPSVGIPIVKLCSNDGWLVTPRQCAEAAVMGRRSLEEGFDPFESADDRLYFRKWLTFLEFSADRGGFRVW